MSWFNGTNADRHFFLLAVILYGVSTVHSVFVWRKGFRRDDHINYLVLLGAFVLHTTAMFKRGFSLQRCPVNNLYEAALFIAWTITAAYLVVGLLPRLRFLGAFASPLLLVMGVFALMPPLDPARGPTPTFVNGWTSLHAALILLAFGAFGLGSVAAIMFLSLEHDLKVKRVRAILSLLPPIQRLEKVTGGLVFAGFVLLSGGLALLPLLERQATGTASHLDPIIPWSLFVWVVYLVLLLMRWRGKGGRRFAWGTVLTFAFVLLTFWGFILHSPAHTS